MTDRADPARDVVPTGEPGEVAPTRQRRGHGRRLRRLVLLVLVPLLLILGGTAWYAFTGRYVTSENAYVKAHITAISTDLDGRVVELRVRNDQRVSVGELLFRLDPEPYWLELQLAEARIEAVRNDIDATHAELHQIEAEIDEANETVRFYEREAARQRQLARSGVATAARLDAAEFELATARQRVRGLREKTRKVLADLGGDPERPVELHPKFIEAMTEKRLAELRLGYTDVRAPTTGIVTQVTLEVGEWLEAGKPAFGLIAIDDTWVVANLKETELTHVEEGQEVELAVDAYPGVRWRARVSSIAPATGAEFAVLPPQNASGNWVKVVQRVPVRIEIEHAADRPTLRAGMTASISIDTKRERSLLTSARGVLAMWRQPAAAQAGDR